jgi:phosphoribosylanthranilate isomerase
MLRSVNMARARVKICGITRPEDAIAAAAAGVDAIGMIFYPAAPRNISVERARDILRVLPPFIMPVGVFVDTPAAEILDLTAQLFLRTVQLNGQETADDVAELEGLAVIKSVRVSREGLRGELTLWKDAPANLIGLVMEPAGTGQAGGSGVANDWSAVAAAIEAGAFKHLPPIIAAGGLKPETVGGVVRQIRPYAVDVSSGVEASLGVKSAEKIEQFVSAVRAAE